MGEDPCPSSERAMNMNMHRAIIATVGLSLLGFTVHAQNPPSQPPPDQSQSLGDAARKAREQHKDAPPAKKTFSNDDLGTIHNNYGISKVGQTPAPPAADAQKTGTPALEPKKDEAYWHKRFKEARAKIALAEKELDVMQRELNLNQVQYYSDPNQALKQQYSREDINEKTKKIDEKKAEVAQLQQALADLTDELRRAGGPPGWGN